jgi:hypothetical protein
MFAGPGDTAVFYLVLPQIDQENFPEKIRGKAAQKNGGYAEPRYGDGGIAGASPGDGEKRAAGNGNHVDKGFSAADYHERLLTLHP